MHAPTYHIYLVRHNGTPVYVGFTSKTIEVRWKEHCMNPKRMSVFHRAIRKYGKEEFTIETLYTGEDFNHTLKVMEPQFIAEHNTFIHNGGGGYNMTMGGEGSVGFTHSEESKMKQSVIMKGKSHPQSDETRKKISEAHMGKKREPFSEEWIRNMAKATKGRRMPPRTETHRRKLSEAMKGIRRGSPSEETRKKLSEANNAGRFKKGNTPHNKGVPSPFKGVPRSVETKEKISASHFARHAAKIGPTL